MTPTIGPTSKVGWIVQHYRDRILNGDLQPGADLPSITHIRTDWGVSRATAQRALTELRDAGWIITRAGKQSLVSPEHPQPPEYH